MDRFDLQDYIIDFERINELTEKGFIKKDSSVSENFPKIEYSNVNVETIKKFLTYFQNYFKDEVHKSVIERSSPDSKRDNNYFFFVVETLIFNKILINKRKDKIKKLLDE